MQGSDMFGTQIMRTDEAMLYLKSAMKEGVPADELMLHLAALDDMLLMQRRRSIDFKNQFTATGRKRKDATFQSLLSGRMAVLIKDIEESRMETEETESKDQN